MADGSIMEFEPLPPAVATLSSEEVRAGSEDRTDNYRPPLGLVVAVSTPGYTCNATRIDGQVQAPVDSSDHFVGRVTLYYT